MDAGCFNLCDGAGRVVHRGGYLAANTIPEAHADIGFNTISAFYFTSIH